MIEKYLQQNQARDVFVMLLHTLNNNYYIYHAWSEQPLYRCSPWRVSPTMLGQDKQSVSRGLNICTGSS